MSLACSQTFPLLTACKMKHPRLQAGSETSHRRGLACLSSLSPDTVPMPWQTPHTRPQLSLLAPNHISPVLHSCLSICPNHRILLFLKACLHHCHPHALPKLPTKPRRCLYLLPHVLVTSLFILLEYFCCVRVPHPTPKRQDQEGQTKSLQLPAQCLAYSSNSVDNHWTQCNPATHRPWNLDDQGGWVVLKLSIAGAPQIPEHTLHPCS